jgi:hypothetical protein
MCMVYRNCFTICVLIVINKQTNKKIKIHYLLLKFVTWENKNKTFMNVCDLTRNCYKLACMDGVKT